MRVFRIVVGCFLCNCDIMGVVFFYVCWRNLDEFCFFVKIFNVGSVVIVYFGL